MANESTVHIGSGDLRLETHTRRRRQGQGRAKAERGDGSLSANDVVGYWVAPIPSFAGRERNLHTVVPDRIVLGAERHDALDTMRLP